jgi:hypothetical protein
MEIEMIGTEPWRDRARCQTENCPLPRLARQMLNVPSESGALLRSEPLKDVTLPLL